MFSIAVNRFDLKQYEKEITEVEKMTENFDSAAIGQETELDSLIYELEGTTTNLRHHFKLTCELIIKVLRDYLKYEGRSSDTVATPRSVLSTALEYKLISDYDLWEKLLKLRNGSTHEYLLFAELVVELRIITERAYPAFKNIYDYLSLKYEQAD